MPHTHHRVRETLLGACVVDLVHEVRSGRPDRLRLRLSGGETVVLEGSPLNMRFGYGSDAIGYERFEPSGEGPITAEQALEGINRIRSSIVGAQMINWSEHVYPLVALLDRAGYRGLPYPEARVNIGTLIDFRDEALVLLRAARGEALTRELHDRVVKFLERTDPGS